jgi:hypothetical protein
MSITIARRPATSPLVPISRRKIAEHVCWFVTLNMPSAAIALWISTASRSGRNVYSFEVFNDDYKQLPPPMVAARARRSVKWLTGLVSRRSLPARRASRTVGR